MALVLDLVTALAIGLATGWLYQSVVCLLLRRRSRRGQVAFGRERLYVGLPLVAFALLAFVFVNWFQ